ncbi:thioredoxin family protein [Fischerella thermalis]|uniref:thioredoxin family protein n=1 Tax=Fischerella thermalis TaxID=372787 RepID=UPI0019E87C5D|nr:thioredoxin family protein [Fischerella thermalis]MBF1989845.1 thioredoxin family protein [Fischerella thermalis M58_A2018_009]MBF2061148.1 thioredoxin family protein [Fischerella thermalis M66_A2018_004]MBF2069988.1 thioredoxin family protein [Fischerella thermalis M48_A2018_028]
MAKRLVEVFIAGCYLCDDTIKLVRELACPHCEVQIYNLHEENSYREKVAQYGIHRIPAVVVDGKLAECCVVQQPVSREALIAAGIGNK